jgi:glycosyltransferase involved in cell wall biosynthesis
MVEAAGVRVRCLPARASTVAMRGWNPGFRRIVMEEARHADIVHNHGLWMWPNAYAREAALAAGKPLVISPRGMLEAWSLNRSKLRKAVAWQLFEKRNLRSAAMFHATAESEAGSIRHVAHGIRRAEVPIVVAPNGVDLPDLSRSPGRGMLEEKFPQLKHRRWVVFMSRLHPKKGIDVLLRAWARQKVGRAAGRVQQGAGEARDRPILILAGGDLIGYRQDVERMVKEMNLETAVVITGEVKGEMKECLLGNADIFVLPSYSENFGIVVAEAMAWGLPVITSKGTPWKEVADLGAGWWVAAEERELTDALENALAKAGEELRKMGRAGRGLVETCYSWDSAAATLCSAYAKICRK